jgi:multidrug efflux pump subunit AcrA (membrane-fusion protein)
LNLSYRILIGFGVAFFAGMLLLTVSARTVHRLRLPAVTVVKVTRQNDPNGWRRNLVVPIEALYEDAFVYVVEPRTINGEELFFTRQTSVTIGDKKDGFVEVTDGVHMNQLVIVGSEEPISHNQEVWYTFS